MSIPRLLECSVALLMLLQVGAVTAADDNTAQRERIARERSVVERESQAAQAACAAQFAVTACVDRAKTERSRRLLVLDRERAVLDDELRKRRAAERLERVRQRRAEAAVAPPEVTVRSRTRVASEPTALEPPNAERAPRVQKAPLDASVAETAAAVRAASAARRASEADAHRIAVEKRNHARAKQRTPVAPLPALPPASQASR
jgi:colicin import membrane protein